MAKNKQPKEPTFIEKLNTEYTKEKSALAKLIAPGGLNDKLEQFGADISALKKDLAIKDIDLQDATRKNDTVKVKQLSKEIEDLHKQKEAIEKKLKKAKDFLDNAQKKVDDKFSELSKDPETKEKLDSILYKKYNSKRKAEANKKTQLQTIKEIADTHPAVKNMLKGIEGYNKMITKCNRIINTYNKLSTKSPLTPEEQATLAKVTADLAKAQADLPIAKTKLAARQADLKNYLMKNHPEMAKTFNFNDKTKDNFDKFINEIHSYGDLSRQMQGCDKTITNCTKAMNGLTVSQELKNFSTPTDNSLPAVADPKPSWLHPIKRIMYNIEARRARKLANEQNEFSRNEQRKSFRDDLKLSKDEYNSEIVQKYLENYEKGLHDAAKQNRGNGNSR